MVNLKINPSNIRYETSHRCLKAKNFNTKSMFILSKNENILLSIESGYITNRQLNASLLSLKKLLKHQSKIFYNVFPNIPVSKRPLELTLGRGKATSNHFVTNIKPGNIIFKVKGDNKTLNKISLLKASKKFNFLTKVI